VVQKVRLQAAQDSVFIERDREVDQGGGSAGSEDWVQQMRSPVQFSAGVQELLREPGRVLLEVGPGQTLRRLALRQPEARRGRLFLASLPGSANPASSTGQGLLTTLGRLWEAGVVVDWEGLHVEERRRRIPLPTYPFDRRRHWIDPAPRLPVPASARTSISPSAMSSGLDQNKQLDPPFAESALSAFKLQDGCSDTRLMLRIWRSSCGSRDGKPGSGIDPMTRRSNG